MKLTRKYHYVLAALVIVTAALAGLVYYMTAHGFSAQDQPTWIESVLARTMRHLGVPRAARARVNPLPDTPETIKAGMEHYADHCSLCHANDGSGDTEIGRNLYPKTPDMRLPATQRLSDGELFYIIENGVRLTGMPGWGTGHEGEKGSWELVRFIRRLPQLTPDELKQMEELNPKGPAEMGMPNEEDFLSGKTPGQVPAAGHKGHKDGTDKN